MILFVHYNIVINCELKRNNFIYSLHYKQHEANCILNEHSMYTYIHIHIHTYIYIYIYIAKILPVIDFKKKKLKQ